MSQSSAPPYIPPELVEDILSYLCSVRPSLQRDLSSCTLVSRAWSRLARRRRYKTFSFDLDHPLNKDGTVLQLRSDHGHNSLGNLLKAFDNFPHVAAYIQTFEIRAHCFPIWLAEDEVDDFGQIFEPVPDSRKGGVDAEDLIAVFQRLTSLRHLHLPDVVVDWRVLGELPGPIFRELDSLKIQQPPNHGDVSLDRFCCFMRLFGSVNRMSLENVQIYESPDNSKRKLADLSQLAVRSLTVADQHWNDWSDGLLRVLRDTPSMRHLTSLELCYLVPQDMATFCDVVQKAVPNLEHLTLQLEQPSHHENSDSADLLHYRQLDLENCHALHVVSFRIWFYIPFDTRERLNIAARRIGTDVVDFLGFFIDTNAPPNLHCLDLKLCSQVTRGRDVDLSRVEDILLDGIAKGRFCKVAVTTWWSGMFNNRHWTALRRVFSRLTDNDTLLNSYPLMT